MQSILERPAQATHYLYFAAPQWIDQTFKRFQEHPILALGMASAVGSTTYGVCATIALCVQLPCSAALVYIEKRKDQRKSE